MNEKYREEYERCLEQGEQYIKTGNPNVFRGGLLRQMEIVNEGDR